MAYDRPQGDAAMESPPPKMTLAAFLDLENAHVEKHEFVRGEVFAMGISPSTEGYDRGLKFSLYRALPSLVEYLLVHPDTREASVFRRGADGLFTLHDFSNAAQIELASIGCALDREELFEGVDAEPQA
jgi:Putative restriction endonuclease